MRNVVFLVKNGIGYGHLRRALILAEALLDAGQVRPVIVSQASSLAIFANTRVPVVNFPLLHRVPSAVAEDWYTDVLDKVLDWLDPAVVVEDTYPDQRYAKLPSLDGRPGLLVLRRLDRESFDTMRASGAFGRYDEILVIQSEEEFDRECHSDATRAAVAYSGRFRLVGPVHRTATLDEVARARAEYATDRERLVVVSGGAGGDQMPDGYGDRLFRACHTVAATLAREGVAAGFVLVTGPYYAGRPLVERDNVTVRAYEPDLHALLAAADLAIIKPGHNVLSETLNGQAHLILVPDISFMEGLDEHARRVADEYGGAVAQPDPVELEPLVRAALDKPPRSHRLNQTPTAAIDQIVAAVHHRADHSSVMLPPRGVLLTMSTTAAPAGATVVADPRKPDRLYRHICSALAHTPIAHIGLDATGMTPDEQTRYLESAHKWLAEQQIQLLAADDYRQFLAQRLLEKP